ncbi:hypothetical protein [Megasphaera sp. An286]|jgi:hypothetical protein|uniref:hypothetical protein n=1 Tax=Megasphaera sp. An286 TaxID=1965622 RepID=UPI000B3BB660|nr:hypothetical protein [Megasphaera sp. An286]OUO48010.1 hypothetical protein B5F80_02650 [Megasphaera sp. An286]
MEESKRIAVFLDLLGFSELVKRDKEAAYNNLNKVSRHIHTMYSDWKKLKKRNLSSEERELFLRTSVDSFEYLLFISDSLIIGARAQEIELFICQLSNFISKLVIEQLENFQRRIENNIDEVKDYNTINGSLEGEISYPNAFPILFRGGMAVGDAVFHMEPRIADKKYSQLKNLNVYGKAYVEAVHLESSGKGPRVFCREQDVIDLKEELPAVQKVKNEVYEIIWPYYTCLSKSIEHCPEKAKENINKVIEELLSPALNLSTYYWKEGAISEHYMELLRLIWKGIILYAEKCLDDREVEKIKQYMDQQWYKNLEQSFLNKEGFL